MSLVFIDGFDHYQTADLTGKWNANFLTKIVPGAGRNGTQGLDINFGNIRKTFLNTTTVFLGFAFQPVLGVDPSSDLVSFQSNGGEQVKVRINPDLTLSAYRGGSLLGTTAGTLSQGIYAYLEFGVVIHPTTGSIEVRINTVSSLSVTNIFTDPVGTTRCNSVVIGEQPGQTLGSAKIDDVYIANAVGVKNNTFLGDVMVLPIHPNGAGASTVWVPTGGANYANAADVLQDGDATYNTSAFAPDVDLYELEDLAAAPLSIKGIQWNAWMKKTDASSYQIKRVLRVAGTDYEGTPLFTPSTSYADFTEVIELNPATGLDWTQATINALQAGAKLASVV